MFVYLGVEVANTSVFAIEPDFGGEGFDLESLEVKNRIEEMVQETIGLSERMERNDK
jgi:NAD(P)H-dependent FMN reductase